MSIVADSQGRLRGKFTIPQNVPAGAKTVVVCGTATEGQATFTGQGTQVSNTLQNTITTQVWRWNADPLAQTFTPDRNCQFAGVDLWFTHCGGLARVQLRNTQNGFPGRSVLTEVVLPRNAILTNGQPTRALFAAPVSLAAGEEYSLVVLCDDAVTALAVAELSKFDAAAQRWVTSQPYTVGTLLSSSNASTWTAHQEKDMTFRLLEAVFTATSREVDMGAVDVSGVTDLMVFGLAQTPSAATRMEYALALGANGETMTVSPGQSVRLASAFTGQVRVKARLYGEANASPVLWPGAQLVCGKVAESAEYYTRSIPAVGASKAVLVYDAVIPSGASVTVRIKRDDGSWQPLSADGSVQQGDGLVEYRFRAVLNNVNAVKVKFTLTGTSAARPRVRNIRLMAVI